MDQAHRTIHLVRHLSHTSVRLQQCLLGWMVILFTCSSEDEIMCLFFSVDAASIRKRIIWVYELYAVRFIGWVGYVFNTFWTHRCIIFLAEYTMVISILWVPFSHIPHDSHKFPLVLSNCCRSNIFALLFECLVFSIFCKHVISMLFVWSKRMNEKKIKCFAVEIIEMVRHKEMGENT